MTDAELDELGKSAYQAWHEGVCVLHDLDGSRIPYEGQAESRKAIFRKVAEAVIARWSRCRACNGTGKRWYTIQGMDTCDLCKGSKVQP